MPITRKKQKTEPKKPKHLILNGFDMMCPSLQAAGLWKHPDDKSRDYNTIEYWTNLAKLLEKGKFNALFIADTMGAYDVYNGPRNYDAAASSAAQFPVNEPFAVVPAMAAVTKNLSFAVTASTISEAPYHFARRLATLDHLTNGRAGWNIVSSYLDSAARNLLNGQSLPEHDSRYERTQEYIEVLFLSSWADDAVKVDPKTKIFSDPNLIREINYEGEHFKVPGPSIFEPTPQRIPVLLQAGASSRGTTFAAKNAEAVFVRGFTPEHLKLEIEKLKKKVVEAGRNPDDVKTVQLVNVITAPTHDEAIAKYEDYKQYVDKEGTQALIGGWTGALDLSKYEWDQELEAVESNAIKSTSVWTQPLPGDPPNLKKTRATIVERMEFGAGIQIVGDPNEVADELIRWHEISGVDGFNFIYTITPGSFEDLVEYVIPVLQERGYAQKEYPKEGLTFREQLFGTDRKEPHYLLESHPAYDLRWRAGETKEEFEERFKEAWAEYASK
ncbi:LOW QUALITY PROTEIN: dmoA Dimethyl-sulfide monooxygenase [Candida maltosa Xu316]